MQRQHAQAVTDLITAKARVAELQAALSSALSELAAVRASAAEQQVRACCQLRHLSSLKGHQPWCLYSMTGRPLVAAVQPTADVQHVRHVQVDAQRQVEAQGRKLSAEISRLQAEQVAAASSSSRQLEALQVVVHRHNIQPCCAVYCHGLLSAAMRPSMCGTVGREAAAAADTGPRTTCKRHRQCCAQRCRVEGKADDDEGRGGQTQKRA